MAYGTPTGDIPDPVARAIDGLLDEVQRLRARVNQLEDRGAGPESLERVGLEGRTEDEESVTSGAPPGKC